MQDKNMKAKTQRWCWLEEFKNCGCSNVVKRKKDVLGYCPVHGTDRVRLSKLPSGMTLGYVRIG